MLRASGARGRIATSRAGSHVALGPQPAEGEEPVDRRECERDPAEHDDSRECWRGWDAEGGEAAGERGFLDADAAGHGRDAAEHGGADLHDDEFRVVEMLVECEEAQAEHERVDDVACRVAPDELRRLVGVAYYGPHVSGGAFDCGHDLPPNL